MILPLDVAKDGQFDDLFDSIRQHWGRIDICLHSIAFCPAKTCIPASPITRAQALPPPWTSRSTRSSAWCAAPPR